ncbi:hypothetical protein [Streptomyces sp. SID1328]|nr:hypothetical protein [Streptomyces sp. SID1328]
MQEDAAVHTAGVTRTVLETVSDEDQATRLEPGPAASPSTVPC